MPAQYRTAVFAAFAMAGVIPTKHYLIRQESPFYLLELARVGDICIPAGQHSRNQRLQSHDALFHGRIESERLRNLMKRTTKGALVLSRRNLLVMQSFQCIDKRSRIVARRILIFHSQQVRFKFCIAGEFSQRQRPDLSGSDRAGSSHIDGRKRNHIPGCSPRRIASPVPRGDVRDFMRDQALQFSFAVQPAQQSLIDIKKTARQCKVLKVG